MSRKNQITARQAVERGCVVLDTETTGLDARAQAVEIAVVDALNGKVLFYERVRPTVPVDPSAYAVHGISGAQAQTALGLWSVWPMLYTAIAGRVIATYNADFDRRIMVETVDRAGGLLPFPVDGAEAVEYLIRAEWFCVMKAAANGRRWMKLADAARAYGFAPVAQHNALGDAQTARLVLLKLAGVI